MRRRIQGEEHPDTLPSAKNLASTLACQAKYAEAEEMLRATHEVCLRVFDGAHPDTAQTLGKVR